MLDFVRIACAVPAVKVADVKKNTQDICAYMEKADAQNADIVVFPELALTGYSCGDLFFQDALQDAAKKGLAQIAACAEKHPNLTAVVGMPLRLGSKLYNCAAVFSLKAVITIYPIFPSSISYVTVFSSMCSLVAVRSSRTPFLSTVTVTSVPDSPRTFATTAS